MRLPYCEWLCTKVVVRIVRPNLWYAMHSSVIAGFAPIGGDGLCKLFVANVHPSSRLNVPPKHVIDCAPKLISERGGLKLVTGVDPGWWLAVHPGPRIQAEGGVCPRTGDRMCRTVHST